MDADLRPRTAPDYVDLIKQALFEVEDLRAAIEYDAEFMGGAEEFVGELEAQLRALYQSMVEGKYTFGRGDLAFMSLVEEQDDRTLPFKHLLRLINATHKMGLNAEAD